MKEAKEMEWPCTVSVKKELYLKESYAVEGVQRCILHVWFAVKEFESYYGAVIASMDQEANGTTDRAWTSLRVLVMIEYQVYMFCM